jgi:enoyl-[acyl-carrier protein] reductase II
MRNIFCERLGILHPIIQGPMAWASDARLSASVSNAGGLGIMGVGFCPADIFEAEVKKAKTLTTRPFGLNIITCIPGAENLLEIALREKVKVVEVETFPGHFDELYSYVKALKSAGAVTIGKGATVDEARENEEAGVDMISVKGCDGGGHVFGFTGAFSLIPQVVDAVSIPVINSSGVADGRGIAASFMLGAAGVEIGSRFLVSEECPIHENYKKAILAAKEGDTVLTGVTVGDSVRGLKNALTEKLLKIERECSLEEARERIMEIGRGSLRKASTEGDMVEGSIVVGQNVGLLNKIQPVSEIMAELIADYTKLLAIASRLVNNPAAAMSATF